jgi:small nuclear ribonucleoprotein (snRNP)-like protein
VLVLAAAMPCDAAWAPPAAAPLLALRGGAPSSDGDEQRRAQLTTEEMMQKMIGALVTVSLKVGPQLRGRLKDIDVQMNIMLQRPVEQWVNGTLAAVDDGDVFVRCHNVIDFGVLRGTEDPATVQILEDLGIRPGRGWDDGKVTLLLRRSRRSLAGGSTGRVWELRRGGRTEEGAWN